LRNACHDLILGAAAIAAAAVLSVGCDRGLPNGETVATVDGERITALEVREAIGIPGGVLPATVVGAEEKRKIVMQIAETRLLARDARGMGLDNTPEYATAAREGEATVTVTGLFRKELDARSAGLGSGIDAKAKAMMAKDNTLGLDDARARAGQEALGGLLARIQSDSMVAADNAYPATVDNEVLTRISKGEDVPDNVVLGRVGEERVSYGEAKALVRKSTSGMDLKGKSFDTDVKVLGSVLRQELSARALVAYAKSRGGDRGPLAEHDRSLQRNRTLVGLLAERKIFKGLEVTDAEIEKAYGEHKEMYTRGGAPVPLAEVRGQIRSILLNEKRRKAVEAYLVPLKAGARITVTDSLLPRI
jgi:hypothetical protein